MPIFDDAIFDVQLSNLTTDASTRTTTLDVSGVTFNEASYYDFWPYFIAASPWTITPLVDPLITGGTATVNVADWDIDVGLYDSPGGVDLVNDDGTMDMYVVTLGSTTTPMGPTEPPDPSLLLATVPLDLIYVTEGEHYWMEVLYHFPNAASYDDKPEAYWHMVTWVDSSNVPIGAAIQTPSTVYYSPDGTPRAMIDLDTAPAGASAVRVELGVWPHYLYTLSPGSRIGFGRVVVFAESPTKKYDDVLINGWQGRVGLPSAVYSGRRSNYLAARSVISGLDGEVEASVGIIDTPPTHTAQTIVLAVTDNRDRPVGWGGMYDMFAGFSGSVGLLYNSDISDMVPVVAVGAPNAVIGVALTVDASEDSAIVSYYDLLHTEAPLFTNHLDTTVDFRDGTVYLNSINGLIRMGVWDRILSTAELQEALQTATLLEPRDMVWHAPDHNGGLPITGYVISAFDGETVTETKLAADATSATLPLTTASAWIQAENKVGRSQPSGVAIFL